MQKTTHFDSMQYILNKKPKRLEAYKIIYKRWTESESNILQK